MHRWVEAALAGDPTSNLGSSEVPYALPTVSAVWPARPVRPAPPARPPRPVRAARQARPAGAVRPLPAVTVDASGIDRASGGYPTSPRLRVRPDSRARNVRADVDLSGVIDGALLLSAIVFMLLLIAGGVWLTALAV